MAGITTQTATLATIPTATPIAADTVGSATAPTTNDRIQYVKIDFGAAGSSSPVTLTNAFPTQEVGRAVLGAYRCGSGQIAGAASAQNLVSIENPTASGRTVYIKRIEIQGPTVTVSLTLKFLYLVGRTTGVPSAGSTLTSQKHATSDSAAVAIVRSGPTATAASGNMWTTTGEQLFTAVGAGNAFQNVGFAEGRESDDIVLAAGEGLLIRAETNNTGYFHSVDISWEEA